MFCLSRGKEVGTRHPALARVKWVWEFGGIAVSAASPLAASPPARRSREITPPSAAPNPAAHIQPAVRRSSRRRPWHTEPADRGRSRRRSRLTQARRSWEITPLSTGKANPPTAAPSYYRRRPASDSMPAGPPLTHCPPARL